MLNLLINDFWFDNAEIFKEKIETMSEEEKELLKYIIKFQKGDFSEKEKFVNFFVNNSERKIFVIGMRLFMAIANHEDFSLLNDFFEERDEEDLRVFLAFVEESMSMQAVPYLLALFEDWEETLVGDDIARCICEMTGKEYCQDQVYTIQQLGEYFIEFSNQNDMDYYYYSGIMLFLGDLTKKTIIFAMDCKQRKKPYYADQISSVLSNSVGKKCPVSYGVEITDEIVEELYSYVKSISVMNIEKGSKYFYNHKIM